MFVPFLTLLAKIRQVTNSQERVTNTTLNTRMCVTKTVTHVWIKWCSYNLLCHKCNARYLNRKLIGDNLLTSYGIQKSKNKRTKVQTYLNIQLQRKEWLNVVRGVISFSCDATSKFSSEDIADWRTCIICSTSNCAFVTTSNYLEKEKENHELRKTILMKTFYIKLFFDFNFFFNVNYF